MTVNNNQFAIKRIFQYFIPYLLILISFFHTNTNCIAADDKQKNILILHSYNEGLQWTNDITRGIQSAFSKYDGRINFFYDYMDLKQISDDKYLEQFYLLQKKKYNNIKFDVILCSDNGALDYLLDHKEYLFPTVPVVYCGVNASDLNNNIPNKYYTGLKEDIEIKENLDLILHFNPSIKKLNVLVGTTKTGLETLNQFQNVIENYKDKFSIEICKNYNISKVKNLINNSNKDTAILCLADPIVDSYGKYKYLNIFKDNFFKNSKIPIYSFWDFDLDYGAVGGKLISGYYQGYEAANIALRIINGEDIENIPIINNESNKYIFDYNQLSNFGIKLATLPNGSIILNKPASFYESNKHLILTALIIFLILVFFIVVLTIHLIVRRKSERKLSESYQELQAVYEELEATEQTLREKYDELQKSWEDLDNSEARYRLAIEGSNDVIWEWNINSEEIYFSDKWYSITGYEENKYFKLIDLLNLIEINEDKELFINSIYDHIEGKSAYAKAEIRIRTKNSSLKWILCRGKVLYNANGKPIKMSGSITDISERKNTELQIRHMAYYDFLTDLPNRRMFIDKLKEAISKPNYSGTILYVDIDNLGKINNIHGHKYGDIFLKLISNKLSSIVTDANGLVARFSESVFTIFIENINDISTVETIAKNIVNLFNTPLEINGFNNYVTLNIGVVMYPQHGEDIETILKNADVARFISKRNGKNQYSIFNLEIAEKILKNIAIENELKHAIDNNEFELYYQPQVETNSCHIYGMESLIRWKSSKFGFVSPLEFISIAERSGLIIELGKWIIDTACRQNREWRDKGYTYDSIAINVSAIQFQQDDFIQYISHTLEKYSLPPSSLEIEITESIFINSSDKNIKKLYELKELGVKLSLDDFGTGYSSLSYLAKLPVDTLKIDKSFIDEINLESKCSFIARGLRTSTGLCEFI